MEALTNKNPPTALRNDGSYVFHHPPKFLWKAGLSVPPSAWERYAVYLHVPFCRAICTFCTFERRVYSRDLVAEFASGLWNEIAIRSNFDSFIDSPFAVYMGGGTASLLSNDDLKRFLSALRANMGLKDGVECTLECEPGTKQRDDFVELHGAGVTRISIGVQSFTDAHLRKLNRHHSSVGSRRMISDAQAAGIPNVHIDLIYGLPGQTFLDWKKTVDLAASLGVQHISAYRLIVFSDEVLHRKLAAAELEPLPDPHDVEDMRMYARDTFGSAGYGQYSLTEFARPGYECKYVRSNWDGSDYLGFGPAAYSRHANHVWENTVFQSKYRKDTDCGMLPIGKSLKMKDQERLSRDVAMGLCLLAVNLSDVEKRTGAQLSSKLHEQIKRLIADGFLSLAGDVVTMTNAGVQHATHVMKSITATG